MTVVTVNDALIDDELMQDEIRQRKEMDRQDMLQAAAEVQPVDADWGVIPLYFFPEGTDPCCPKCYGPAHTFYHDDHGWCCTCKKASCNEHFRAENC